MQHERSTRRSVSLYGRILSVGVDQATPAQLVDRVLYSNWVYIVATLFTWFAVIPNLRNRYWLLASFDAVYQCTCVACFVMNAKRHYLASRLTFVGVAYAIVFIESAAQGPVVQMEHLFLAGSVLAFSMFHPSERRFSIMFAILGAVSYLVLVNRTSPLLDIDPAHGRYTSADLLVNQVVYVGLLICSLIGIANAYGRATRIVDEQRAKLFEHGRLSSLASVACAVAHEINTPLMTIDIHLDDLSTKLANRADDYETVEILGQLSRRIATIVRSFKLLSYSDSSDPVSTTTLQELVQAALDISAGRVKPLGISISTDLRDPGQQLRCRIVALSQVILNLIHNSIDAVAELVPTRRWIRIESTSTDTVLEIAVTDSGQISSELTRSRLFESFFTTKPIGKGTGLGLSISRQTVEQHGGRLYFDAAAHNTRFVIELPKPNLVEAHAA